MARKSTVKGTGGMTVQEAGRRGGNAVKTKYGPDYYSNMGKKGAAAFREQLGSPEAVAAFYAGIGKKGGQTVAREHGSEFFAEIGHRGGEAVKTKHNANGTYYAEIGRKGAESPNRTLPRGRPPGSTNRQRRNGQVAVVQRGSRGDDKI